MKVALKASIVSHQHYYSALLWKQSTPFFAPKSKHATTKMTSNDFVVGKNGGCKGYSQDSICTILDPKLNNSCGKVFIVTNMIPFLKKDFRSLFNKYVIFKELLLNILSNV